MVVESSKNEAFYENELVSLSWFIGSETEDRI
jgi:hypothetical protein